MAKAFRTAVLALAVCGCPAESKQPLGAPEQARVDARLLGGWACREAGEPDPEQGHLQIVRFNEREYYIEIDEGKESDARLRAYSTSVGGATLLNVQAIAADWPRGFYFARYRFEPDGSLHFRVLDNEALRAAGSSSRALARFAEEHLGDPSLYQQPGFRCTSDER